MATHQRARDNKGRFVSNEGNPLIKTIYRKLCCGKVCCSKKSSYKRCNKTCRISTKAVIICDFCKNKFKKHLSRVKNNKNKFCSRKCIGLFLKNRKTEDHPLYRGIGNSNAKLYRERAKQKNPEHIAKIKKENNVVYSVRRRTLGGTFNRKEWVQMKENHDFTCLYCGLKEPEIKLTADHIVPVVRWEEWVKENPVPYLCGDKENIQPLCVSCNCKKNRRLPEEIGKKQSVDKVQKAMGYKI